MSLTVGKGEIVGLAGLEGQGQGDLLFALFGVYVGVQGEVWLEGRQIHVTHPAKAVQPDVGLAMIPADRKTEGLILPMSVGQNMTMAILGRIRRGLAINGGLEKAAIDKMMKRLAVKAPSADIPVGSLSGGNQQKVSLAKWLLTDARVYLLYDPTRGIDVGTKQELYRLMRQLADEGSAVLFFSTDLTEIVGMCDRALVMYEGRIVQELVGENITETNLVTAALNLGATVGEVDPAETMKADWEGTQHMSVDAAHAVEMTERKKKGSAFSRHYRILLAYGVLVGLIIIYRILFERVFTLPVLTNTMNQGMALAITSMAQTLVILTSGIDLSIGSIVTLSNVIAATQMQAGVAPTILVCIVTLIVGALAGAFNGVLVAYGRLAPIIVTLATSSIFNGIALYVLPRPGGNVPEWYTDLLTGRAFSLIPAALILLILIVVLFWVPLKRSPLGQAIYAVGSSESSARMSGVNTTRTKLLTYSLAGMLSALAGLLLTAQTATGDASQGGAYTLNSIAATVIGGTAFTGGVGGVGGSIAGAYVFSIIPNVLFAARVSPFMKEFLQGAILVLTIAVGAARVFRIKNRLDILR